MQNIDYKKVLDKQLELLIGIQNNCTNDEERRDVSRQIYDLVFNILSVKYQGYLRESD